MTSLAPPTSLRTGKSPGTKLLKQPSTRNVHRDAKDARKSRVDDKIKRRMSTRYADISVPQPTENVPALPSVPAGFRPSHAQMESEGSIRIKREKQKEDARAAENRLLDKQDFEPDSCKCGCTSLSSVKEVDHASCQILS